MAAEGRKQVTIPEPLYDEVEWVRALLPWSGNSASSYVRTAVENQIRRDLSLIMEQMQLSLVPEKNTLEALDEARRRLKNHMESRRPEEGASHHQA